MAATVFAFVYYRKVVVEDGLLGQLLRLLVLGTSDGQRRPAHRNAQRGSDENRGTPHQGDLSVIVRVEAPGFARSRHAGACDCVTPRCVAAQWFSIPPFGNSTVDWSSGSAGGAGETVVAEVRRPGPVASGRFEVKRIGTVTGTRRGRAIAACVVQPRDRHERERRLAGLNDFFMLILHYY